MNGRQKEVLQTGLKDEQAVLDSLTKNYTSALADIKRNIRELQSNPLTQSKAYQLEFQKQLERQVSGILDNLQGKNFASIADYLQKSYVNGFVGNMYDLQGQGVPLVIPINQNQVLKAVEKTGDDFKLANKLGVSTKELKKQVQQELSRGLATELSYADIARNISEYGLSNMHRSLNIARTEGHRVQNTARLDSMNAAKDAGADIVKQWDATLDGATRPEHAELDGQIVELDEDFTVGSYSAPCPGMFGDPYMDCNCRCAMLQRARWAVKDESTYQKWNNETGGFIECSGYEDFKEKYLNAAEELKNSQESGIISVESFRTFTSGDEVNKFFGGEGGLLERKKSVEQQWLKSLSADESQAISYYCADGYYDVNAYFRQVAGCEYIDADAMKELAKDLDSAIDKFNLSENITVYRGIDNDALKGLDLSNLVGSIYEDKGYMSTSPIHADIVERKDALLEIQVFSGQGRGAYVNSLSGFKDDEYEFLLKRGTKCEITSVDLTGDKPIIRMKVIDE